MEMRTTKVGDAIITGYETDYVFQTIEKTGDFYEAELLKKWTPLLGNPRVILDIGANLGNHTVFWGKQLNADKIFSIEPYKPNYELLCKNIEENGLKNVTALNIALGEKDGFATVKDHNPENYGGTSFSYTDEVEKNDAAAKVKTADSIVEEYHIAHVDFLKIDTEGFELSVIKGLLKTIDRDMPILWIEVGSETVAPLCDLLEEKGYVLVDMVGANLFFLPKDKRQNQAGLKLERVIQENMTLLSKVNTYYSNYEKSKKWLQNKNEQLQEVTDKLNAAVNEKTDAQRVAEGQRRKLEEQIQLVTEKYKKAEENYQSMKETVRIRNEQLERAGEEHRKVRLELENSRRTYIELSCEHSNMHVALEDSRRAYDTLSEKHERTKACLEESRREYKELSCAHVQLNEVLEESRQEYEGLESEHKRVETELQQLRQIYQQLEKQQAELQTRMEENVQQNINLAQTVQKQNAEIAQLKEQLLRNVEELEKEERLLLSVKQQLLQMNNQLQQAKQQNRIYEEKLDKVYGTWYGRFVLKCYKVLRKIKHMVVRK